MLRAFTRNPWRCFSGVFPCCLHPDLCWELWSSTLGSSGAIPWETVAVALTPISVRFNLLHKCVTCQWEVIFTVVYVPQAKKCQIHSPRTQATMKQKGKREGNTCGIGWDRMKPRWEEKEIILLLCSHGALGARNSLGKLCCLCLCGKTFRLSSFYYSHARTVLCAFGLLPEGRDRNAQTSEEHSLSLCYRTWCLGIAKQETQSISLLIYSL